MQLAIKTLQGKTFHVETELTQTVCIFIPYKIQDKRRS